MTPVKHWLFKLNIHGMMQPLTDRLFKLLYYFRFSEWLSDHRDLEVNDFPAEGNVYMRRYKVHGHIVKKEISNEPINYLEFGVADCETLFWWLKEHTNPSSRFHGFDTFTGLPEDWGIYKKGTFTLEGQMPQVDDPRVQLHKGLFQETLHPFLSTFDNSRKNIVLLDADLYSSTLFVLTTIAPFLKTGDIILFDEFSAPQHEYLAMVHFLKAFSYIRMTPFGAANNYACVAFRVSVHR
jgi:hypothetical protein